VPLIHPDSIWRRFDWILFLPIMGLVIISLAGLYSAGDQSPHLVMGQLWRFAVALAIFLGLAATPPNVVALAAPVMYVAGIAALALVLVVGEAHGGAQRWLPLGPLSLQPSEPMKLILPLTLAAFFSRQEFPYSLVTVGLALVLIAVPVGLVVVEPDLGTAVLLALSGGVLLFLAGIAIRVFLGLAVLGITAAPLIWANLQDYQKSRIWSFLNPQSDPYGAGYHVTQSQIAIGSGGLTGKGWLNGTQAQLDFLPERHTDFIFAVLAEEFGLIGSLLLLALFLAIAGRGLIIAHRSRDTYMGLVAGGLSTMFFLYMVINIGMTTGLLPVVGVPLPLVSFGGSSLVSLMASLGMVMAVALRQGRATSHSW
jgi:rod shape determining protein RodA